EQLQLQARRLLAYGFNERQVLPILRILADASAFTGGDPEMMNRIIIAIGQIRTAGRALGQELRQLTEAGIDVWGILREELGLTQEEIREMQRGLRHLSADIAIPAILRGMQRRFGGAAELIENTYSGMISSIQDNLLLVSQEVTAG